jgi:hypothetical protein
MLKRGKSLLSPLLQLLAVFVLHSSLLPPSPATAENTDRSLSPQLLTAALPTGLYAMDNI